MIESDSDEETTEKLEETKESKAANKEK